MKFKRFLSIPILSVLMLMGFVFYITIFVFIEDWVGLQSSAGFLNALIFSFFASLCLFSFFVCVLTDPGSVPASYVPDVEESGLSDSEPKINSVLPRRCDKCSKYKPPRAHHCRVCRKCVLKMDHHCLWVNNCVGYWNYKAFFSLVLYAAMGTIYSTVIIIACAFQNDWKFSGRGNHKAIYVMCGVMMVALTSTFVTLLGWHVYLVIHNMTTIEYYEGIRAAWLARKSGQRYRHPFDFNIYRNITLKLNSVSSHLHGYSFVWITVFWVLGSNMLTWLCPTAISHLKDGFAFPTSRDNS